jgi:hypothetical protein
MSRFSHPFKVSLLIVSSLLFTFLFFVYSIYLQPIFALRVLAVHIAGSIFITHLCCIFYQQIFKKQPVAITRCALASFMVYYFTYTFLSAMIVYFKSDYFELFPRCKTTFAEVLTATLTCFFIVLFGSIRKIKNKIRAMRKQSFM